MEDLLYVSKMLDAVEEDKNGNHRVEKELDLKSQSCSTCPAPCVSRSPCLSSLSFSCLASNMWGMDWFTPKGSSGANTLCFYVQWGFTFLQSKRWENEDPKLGLDRRRALQVALVVKNLPANGEVRDSSVPGSGRSPGGGHGNPLQYSCLENCIDKEAWQASVCRVPKNRTHLKRFSTHAQRML